MEVHTKWNYVAPVVKDYGKVRKSRTVPDQSLGIKEIVKRYVRGIPVDVIQREGVYSDQNDHDLEKLARMDFADKFMYAEELADRAKKLQDELEERQADQREREASDAKQAADKARETASAEPKAKPGIVIP